MTLSETERHQPEDGGLANVDGWCPLLVLRSHNSLTSFVNVPLINTEQESISSSWSSLESLLRSNAAVVVLLFCGKSLFID